MNNNPMKFLFVFVFIQTLSCLSWARDIQLFRRVTVFPLKVESELFEVAEKAWWEVRGELTKDKRFLVATKSFLSKKDAFQPRGELSPSDVIILGRLLDAHVLVSIELDHRVLKFRAYEGEYGQVVWQGERKLHPSIPASEQLPKLSKLLIQDFVSIWPYQGFVFEDRFIGQTVYQEGDKSLVKVQVGLSSEMLPGDPVDFISLKATSLRPLFDGGVKESLVGVGKVVYVDNEVVTVEISKVIGTSKLETGTLAKFPKEYQRLRDIFEGETSDLPTVSAHSTKEGLPPREREIEEKKSLTTSLAFIGSLAVFLILAL
ncbi:MAG: hypothetical protein CL677_06235 [Bdellovibrionaceae bacterium]|nr:hypothetical protein [Pseudobdellovibrionaceae bacterium]